MPARSLRDHADQGEPISARKMTEDEGVNSVRKAMEGRHPNALIWQGFDHEWQYNHRANRLGSYVSPADDASEQIDRWTVAHTAASGSGPDTASFSDYYTSLAAAGVWVTTATVRLDFHGNDTERIVETITPSIPLTDEMQDRDEYVALLNGFDLISNGDADKLIEFDLGIDSQPTDGSGATADVQLTGRITGDCSTPECGDDETKFSLDVHLLLLAGEGDSLTFSQAGTVHNDYDWIRSQDASDEVHLHNEGTVPLLADRNDGFDGPNERATLGITGFKATINKTGGHLGTSGGEAAHLLQFAVGLRDIDEDSDSVSAESMVFFKNWEQGMKYSNPPHSQGALKDEGNVSFELDAAVIEVADALRYDEGSRGGDIQWDADGPSDSSEAEHADTIEVDD
jgi:hypothetical protein